MNFLPTHKRHKRHASFNLHTYVSMSKAVVFNAQDPILTKAHVQL